MSTSLSSRLRAETRDAHTRAERSGVMRDLLRGDIGAHDYATLMRNLLEIYGALERELAHHASNPSLAFIDLPSLARTGAIAADLSLLAPTSWRELPLTSAASDYAARMQLLGSNDPERLVAHAYLRYLGDLSGGQMMRGIVARSIGIADSPGAPGLSFYYFPSIGDQSAFKHAFRASLDAIPANADGVVEEARTGYALHSRMFEELAAIPSP